MCILIVKPAGALAPDVDTLANCWINNPDGAGVAYNESGRIVLRKGFDQFDKFARAVASIPTDSAALIHCRISTSGGVCAELTHPYPISNDVKALRKTKQVLKPLNNAHTHAVAHNGIFNSVDIIKGLNDTASVVANCLAPLQDAAVASGADIMSDKFDALVTLACGYSNKLAILDECGSVKRYGSGWIFDGGCWYSNDTYESWDAYCRRVGYSNKYARYRDYYELCDNDKDEGGDNLVY